MAHTMEMFEKWLQEKGYSSGTVSAYMGEISRFRDFALKEADINIEVALEIEISEVFRRFLGVGKLGQSAINRRYYAIASYIECSQYSCFVKRPILKREHGDKPSISENTVPMKTHLYGRISLRVPHRKNRTLVYSIPFLRNRAMAFLTVLCGVKGTDLCDLTLESLDVNGQKASLCLKDTVIPLSLPVRESILDYLQLRASRKCISPWLFVNSRGQKIALRTVQHGVNSFLSMCGNSPQVISALKKKSSLDFMISERYREKFMDTLSPAK